MSQVQYEYEIQAYYGSQYGWEIVTTEVSHREAREQLKCYNENEPQHIHRIKKVKITKEAKQ